MGASPQVVHLPVALQELKASTLSRAHPRKIPRATVLCEMRGPLQAGWPETSLRAVIACPPFLLLLAFAGLALAQESASTASSTISTTPVLPATSTTSVPTLFKNVTSGYTCSTGLLTYYATLQVLFGINISETVAYFTNFTNALAGNLVTSDGTTEVGSTRTYIIDGHTVSEELVFINTTSPTGNSSEPFLRQRWQTEFSEDPTFHPLMVGNGVTIYNYTEDLTVYRNQTTDLTTLQLFINFCTNNQTAGRMFAASFLLGEIASWYAEIVSAGVEGSATTYGVPSATVSKAYGSSNVSGPTTAEGLTPLPTGPGPQIITESLPIETSVDMSRTTAVR